MHVLSNLIRLGVSYLFRLEVSNLFQLDVSNLFSRPLVGSLLMVFDVPIGTRSTNRQYQLLFEVPMVFEIPIAF
jgi:hypothetical protein